MGGSQSKKPGDEVLLRGTYGGAPIAGMGPVSGPMSPGVYDGLAVDGSGGGARLGSTASPGGAGPAPSGPAGSSAAGGGSGGGGGGSSSLFEMYEHSNMVPTVFRWEHGGNAVYITGAFNGWSRRVPMHRSGADFLYIAALPKGRHAYKFIVDDEWRFAPDQPTVADSAGNINNVIDLTAFAPEEDYGAGAGRARADSIPGVPWGQALPDEDEFSKEPPFLPPHLRNIILNSGPPDGCADPMALPAPLHVTLRHLYCTALKDGLMVQATTQRYRRKAVATVFYAVMPMSSAAAAAAAAAGALPLPGPIGGGGGAAGAGGPGSAPLGSAGGPLASPYGGAAGGGAAGGFAGGVGGAGLGDASAAAAGAGLAGGAAAGGGSDAVAAPPVPPSALPLVAASAASVGVQASGAVEALAARVAAAAAATAAAAAGAYGAAAAAGGQGGPDGSLDGSGMLADDAVMHSGGR